MVVGAFMGSICASKSQMPGERQAVKWHWRRRDDAQKAPCPKSLSSNNCLFPESRPEKAHFNLLNRLPGRGHCACVEQDFWVWLDWHEIRFALNRSRCRITVMHVSENKRCLYVACGRAAIRSNVKGCPDDGNRCLLSVLVRRDERLREKWRRIFADKHADGFALCLRHAYTGPAHGSRLLGVFTGSKHADCGCRAPRLCLKVRQSQGLVESKGLQSADQSPITGDAADGARLCAIMAALPDTHEDAHAKETGNYRLLPVGSCAHA